MRIHLQNPADDPLFDFSRPMWDAASARAPDVGTGHEVTFGATDIDFATAIVEAEALICDAGVVKAHFPCPAPHLKLLFVTNAGLGPARPVPLAAPWRHPA
jgi:hypothetical protein